MNLSLLQNFKANNFFLDPFPHIVIENALPEKLYNELSETYPTNKFNYTNQNNAILSINFEEIQKDNEISDLWKNFALFHQGGHESENFCPQVFDIFAKNIVDTFPNFFKNKEELYNLKVAPLEKDNADIFLFSYLSCNSPVTKKSPPIKSNGSVLDIHPDSPNKFISALFYMKDKNDTAGGDLILHNWRINLPFFLKKIILAKRKNFLNNIIKKFQFLFIGDRKKIQYSSNTLVMWLGSIDAIHSVTAREVTKNFRKSFTLGITYKRNFWDPFSIIDKVLHFKNYKFFKF